MSKEFKIFLLFVLSFLSFWVYRLRQKDFELLNDGIKSREELLMEIRAQQPVDPEASPVETVIIVGEYYRPEPDPMPIAGEAEVDESEESFLVDTDVAHVPEEAIEEASPNPRPRKPRFKAPEHASRQGREAAEAPTESPGEERVYVVKKGETLWKIARKVLGSGTRHKEIMEWNGITDRNQVRAGMKLKLRLPPGAKNQSPARDRATEKPRLAHEVKGGETLVTLAKHYYRDGGRWPRIFEANRGVLADPNKLRPGMELLIPPR